MNLAFSSSRSVGKRKRQKGSVLMIALLLVLLGTFGITAWFGLIAARSLEVEAKETAMNRRIQLNGVKEIARQVASEAFLADDDGEGTGIAVSLGTGYGELTFAPWSGSPYKELGALRYDQIGGVPGQSFTTDLTVSLDDGYGALGSVGYSVQLRTYVPALRGDLLTIHEPAVPATPVTTDSGLLVSGRTVVWDGGNNLGHQTDRLHTSAKPSTISLLNLSGNPLLPDNETFAPRSTGSDFVGRLKPMNESESLANRYISRIASLGGVTVDGSVPSGDRNTVGYDCDGAGKVYIDLGHADLPHLLLQDVGEIHLWGQNNAAGFATAEALEARLICCVKPAGGVWGPLTIKSQHENGRPMVLAIRQEGAASTVTFDQVNAVPSFPRWRMLLELENSPLFVAPRGGVSEIHIRGGIRTDASVDTSQQAVRILRDTGSASLEVIASRAGFVEIYRN